MAEDGFEFIRSAAAGVTEVDFVMVTGVVESEHAVIIDCVLVHGGNSGGFVVVTTEVKALDNETFFVVEELDFGEILLLLMGGLLNSPIKIGASDKIRQADYGDKVHVGFAIIVKSGGGRCWACDCLCDGGR